jgi:DUF971 family protein
MRVMSEQPRHLDLKRDEGLTVTWADGSRSFYEVAYLRRMSPSAEARQLRQEMAKNPLTVLPTGATRGANIKEVMASRP